MLEVAEMQDALSLDPIYVRGDIAAKEKKMCHGPL